MPDRIEVVDGIEMYRITGINEMNPFLMTIVSSSDLWMFVSSAGGLTAGRVEPANCLFPYETDDRLHQVAGRVGPATVVRVHTDGEPTVWEPFTPDATDIRRSLYKSLLGNAVVFEEEHLGLGLTIRYRWAPSDRFGWVRTVSMENRGAAALAVEVVDGLLNLMPWGIDLALQQRMSNLANAYRRSETIEHGIGIFALEALISDRPEPAEALRATTAWTTGLEAPLLSLDSSAIAGARHGEPFSPSTLRTGRPGSFLLSAAIDVEPGQRHQWHIVADVAQTQPDIARLSEFLRSNDDLFRVVEEDIERSSGELWDIVAGADGLQRTGSPTADAHHLANTLFNVMRGGTFLRGYAVESDRFRAFVRDRNQAVADRHADWLESLPDSIAVDDLRTGPGERGDPNLVRLAHEYLPLAFSRRHGDPSRPWNHFAIRVKDEDGAPLLSYQGNWRDIFQNWEALCRSYPDFLPSVIAKFLNASTADGFNPYRITSEGIDWEVLEPDNPWSGIGYWGDHQIVYLYRLLEAQEAHRPGWLARELDRGIYSFADVPYRIVPFDRLLSDPKATVDYDSGAEAATAARVAAVGSDGKLVVDAGGDIVHVTFLEKLLIPALAKLSNFVPRGGIWMNTQRPEWNDANNALVGYGLSMVTLAHLRRYLRLLNDLTDDVAAAHPVSQDIIAWLTSVAAVLEDHEAMVGAPSVDDAERFQVVRQLGELYDEYRTGRYAQKPLAPQPLPADELRRFLGVALRHLDDAIGNARRPDGLYESYNLVRFSDERAAVEHLPLMLEGQVAVISSGLLDAGDVTAVVGAMYESELYRPDVDSFMLYPARPRPPFLERNLVPAGAVESNPLLSALLDAGSDEVITRDVNGRHRFNADFGSVADLGAALDRLAGPMGPLVAEHGAATRHLYEEVFNHHQFTGRSQTMYGYEGIGSVYWHMVAKLLVAVQESILGAPAETDEDTRQELVRLYDRIRQGLGFNRTAAEYGAFPTDPYSHTPPHAGAQQPGMTGQVKEELLTRWAELGLTINHGSIRFTPVLLSDHEFVTDSTQLRYRDAAGGQRTVALGPDAAAFTVCQVSVIVHADTAEPRIVVSYDDATSKEIAGLTLDPETSRLIFDRAGRVEQLDVFFRPISPTS